MDDGRRTNGSDLLGDFHRVGHVRLRGDGSLAEVGEQVPADEAASAADEDGTHHALSILDALADRLAGWRADARRR